MSIFACCSHYISIHHFKGADPETRLSLLIRFVTYCSDSNPIKSKYLFRMIAIHEWAKCHQYAFHAMAEVTLHTQTSLFIAQSLIQKINLIKCQCSFNLVFGRDHLFQCNCH